MRVPLSTAVNLAPCAVAVAVGLCAVAVAGVVGTSAGGVVGGPGVHRQATTKTQDTRIRSAHLFI